MALSADEQAELDSAWETVRLIRTGGLQGRNLRTRLSAAIFTIEQLTGKATQRVEVDDNRDGLYKAEFADGTAVSTSAAAGLPS